MRWSTRLLLFVFVCALAVMCGELVPGCSCSPRGAPAPLVRRQAKLVTGEWVLRYGGTRYSMSLYTDNRYEARLGSLVYRGSWVLSGRTLLVHETRDEGKTWLLWVVDLDDDMCGKTGAGVDVEIRIER